MTHVTGAGVFVLLQQGREGNEPWHEESRWNTGYSTLLEREAASAKGFEDEHRQTYVEYLTSGFGVSVLVLLHRGKGDVRIQKGRDGILELTTRWTKRTDRHQSIGAKEDKRTRVLL